MKKILIFLVVLIVLYFAYSEYKEYQRFHPKNANITASQSIDTEYHNKETVYQYFEAIEQANAYMQMQWSANQIDVRNPESDNASTKLALNTYAKKKAKIKYFETLLETSKQLKSKGLSNKAIKQLETTGLSLKATQNSEEKEAYNQTLLELLPNKSLAFGGKSAFVFELQKLLVKKGFNIPVDGVYKSITSEALKTFETQQHFLPDGKIDLLTLKALLKD